MILPLLQTISIQIEPDRVLNRISSAMTGACMEDVNHEVYGGLYAQRIFGESFEEPAPSVQPAGWRVYGGRWYPDGAGIHVRAGDGPKLVREMPPRVDGTVEAKVAVSNDLVESAALLVRVSRPGVGADEFEGYEVALDGKTRRLILGKHRQDFRLLQAVSAPVKPGHRHRLRVDYRGPRLRVFLDDETTPRIDFTDDQPLGPGAVALRTWRAEAFFSDIRIDGAPAPTSLAGPGVSATWDRLQTGTAKAGFAVEEAAFNGVLCQKIVHQGGPGRIGVANRGLNRWGIAVRKGRAMEGRIYLRGDGGTATVALQSADGSRTYASRQVPVRNAWTKTEFRLAPNVTDPTARFAIWLDRPGTLWADQAVLLDAAADRYRGLPIRRDIAEELIGSGVTFLRYGGTMVNVPGYRWKNMIGDRDRRPPYAGHWYPASTNGFGIFEFLQFCEKAGVGSAFAINVDETPEDAADLADYLTAPVDTPWGRRRAVDGHPQPYRPEYIEIGNEEGIGNPDAEAMARYAERFRLLAAAIRRRNPKLKLVCGAWWTGDRPAMRTVFDAIDGVAAAWDFHFWCDDPRSGAAIDRDLTGIRETFRRWNPRSALKAVVFEENGNRHDVQRALGHATTMNATRRHGDFVLVDCAANALQPWRENDNGWDQGGVFFTTDHAWSMPPADVRRIVERDTLPLRVAAKAEGDLDVLATRSEDGKTIVATLVNVTDKPLAASLTLAGFVPRTARTWSLSGPLNADNPPSGSPRVVPQESTVDAGRAPFGLVVPAHGVVSLRLTR